MIFAIGMAEQPIEHIENDRRPRVADMRAVIDGGAADIEAHIRGIERRKRLFLARGGVIELYFGHQITTGWPGRAAM